MSSLKPEERHQIVVDYLKEINKNTKVFHLRWSEPALLTEKVLTQTPPFWYKRYAWRRSQVENMFYKSEIEMTYQLISAFDEVFGGGYKGTRWVNPAMRGKLDHIWEKLYGKKSSRRGAQINFEEFLKALKLHNVTISDALARNIFDGIDANKNGWITKQEMDQYLAKLDAMDLDNVPNLANKPQMLNLVMSKNVLQCILSEEGLSFTETEFIASLKSNQGTATAAVDPQALFMGNNQVTFDQFKQILQQNNVTISDELARNVFDQMDIHKVGYVTKGNMEQYLVTLNNMNLNVDDTAKLAIDAKLLNLVMTKHILDCVLSKQGLEFVETEYIHDLNAIQDFSDIDPECIAYLNKLGDRDVNWIERVVAMSTMNTGLSSGKYDNILVHDDHVRQLLFGLAAQILDEHSKVQDTAIKVVPNILDECFNKVGNINVVYEHLPEIMDNLFRILDNPKCQLNYQNVKFAMDELIDNIVNTQHPVAVLQLTKIFAGQCKIENAIKAETRNFGLQCLGKIMLGLDSPYLSFNIAQLKAPKVEEEKLPAKGDAYREWLDTATLHQPGPSVRYLSRSSNRDTETQQKHRKGGENILMLGYGKAAHGHKDDDSDDDEKGLSLSVKQQPKRKKTLVDLTSEEIGQEFVDAVSDGLSAAMMDPNRRNKMHAFKTNNILNQLQPEFSTKLERESKKRYDAWDSGAMKAYGAKQPRKALPEMKKIDPKLVQMTTKTKIGIKKFAPSLPDI